MTGLTLILRFVVIALIYIILFRLIRIMIIELKTPEKEKNIEYALEVIGLSRTAGFHVGTIFPIREELTIGRKKNNMIIVNDPYVSAYHARIFMEGGELYLKDMGSTNGTRFNGKVVKEEIQLNIGDIIKIGGLDLKVI